MFERLYTEPTLKSKACYKCLYFTHRHNQACGSIPQGGGKHRRHPGEEGLQKVKVIKDFGVFRKSLNA